MTPNSPIEQTSRIKLREAAHFKRYASSTTEVANE